MEYDHRPVWQALTPIPITWSVLTRTERAGGDEKKMEQGGREGHNLCNLANKGASSELTT